MVSGSVAAAPPVRAGFSTRTSSKTTGSDCVAEEGCQLILGVKLCPAVVKYLWDDSFAWSLLATRATRRAAGNVFHGALRGSSCTLGSEYVAEEGC